MPRGARAPDFRGDFACELEHLVMEEKEPGEADVGNQVQLLVKPRVRAGAEQGMRMPVALIESPAADPGELHVCRIFPVGEVGVAIAELLRQVEPEPFRKLDRGPKRVPIVRPARDHVLGWEERHLLVPPTRGLAGLE